MATTNNSNNNHNNNFDNSDNQQRQLHDRMIQHAINAPEDNDNESTTNCSEIMSTPNEDEESFGPPNQTTTTTNTAGCFAAGTAVGCLVPDDATSGLASAEQQQQPQRLNLDLELQFGPSDCRRDTFGSGGDIQQSDNYVTTTACLPSEEQPPLAEYLAATSPQETDGGGGCSIKSDLSFLLASGGANQTPPSYGTATRLCATLDASKLHDVLEFAQVQQQAQDSSAFRFAQLSSPSGNQYHSSVLGGHNLHQHHLQQQQQHPQQQLANHPTNASSVQTCPPSLFNETITTIKGYNPTLPMGTQQQSFHLPGGGGTSIAVAPLPLLQQQPSNSSGSSLNRPNSCMAPPHLNGSLLGPKQLVDELRLAHGNAVSQLYHHHHHQQQINSRLDNNQGGAPRMSEAGGGLNRFQQQQVGLANLEQQQPLAPINHVISAYGSIQWQQPQTNQCYLPTGSLTTTTTTASTATTTDSAPMATTNYGIQAAVGQPQQQQLDGARSSRKSARIMDAPFAWQNQPTESQAGSFKGDQRQATNQIENQPNWHPIPSHPTSISRGGGSCVAASSTVTTNVGPILQQTQGGQASQPANGNDSTSALANQRRQPNVLNLEQQQQRRTHNNISSSNNDCDGSNPATTRKSAGSQVMRPTSRKLSPDRRSSDHENLEQRQHHHHQQQTNRKRRRHRSTSGRSESPPAGSSGHQVRVDADCALGGGERPILPTSTSSRGLVSDGAPPSNYSSAQTKPGGNNHKRAISAHCWLIDSSDDQTYGPNQQRSRQKQQPHPVATSIVKRSASEFEAANLDRYHHHHHNHQNHLKPTTSLTKPAQAHLTVAMMRQTLEQQRLKQQGDPNYNNGQNLQDYPSTNTASITRYLTTQPIRMKSHLLAPATAGTADDTNNSNNLDLTVSLRTNSIRMERILNRSPNNNTTNPSQRVVMAGSRTMPARRQHHHNQRSRRCLSSSSVSSSSSASLPVQCGTTSGASNHRRKRTSPATAPRLSTLLSLLANLVRRPRGVRSSSVSRSGVDPSGEAIKQQQEQQPDEDEYYPAAPANSISGSVSTGGLRRIVCGGSVGLKTTATSSLGPYTAGGSLAISSSSSTSAYATESSSHLSNSIPNHPLRFLAHPSNNNNNVPLDRPMVMAQLRGYHHHHSQQHQHSQVPPSSASTAGSSLFYSSTSGNSGLQMSTTSGSHGYEYCDDADDRLMNETRFVRGSAINEDKVVEEGARKVNAVASQGGGSSQSSRSSNSDTKINNVDDDDDDHLIATTATSTNGAGHGTGRGGGARGLASATNIMSDHELLSAGSEAGFQGMGSLPRVGCGLSANGATTLAAVVSQATPSVARRRWWWISLKDVLCRRPCGRAAGLGSAGDSEEGTVNAEPAQRYKSLKSRRRHPPSTLENVLSLAKADRVFRTRLLASLLVSCILLGLIGLLCGLIYSRSTSLYQRNRLGLLMDDSDYDLSWLWPQDTLAQFPAPGHLQQAPGGLSDTAGGGGGSARYRILEHLHLAAGASGTSRSPTEQLMMDGSLRGPLIMIEQSEQLAQYQQTIAYMTNLQLANDRFIDLTQIARRLVPAMINDEIDEMSPKNQTNSSMASDFHHQPVTKNSPHLEHALPMSESDLELVSLTLLSNLHWPLVKWRHQNQQSMASFLSSFAVSSPAAAGAVQPHLRSLLSVLLLAEASSGSGLPKLPAGTFAYNNSNNNTNTNLLQQFARLNQLLKGSSYHIISCSSQLNEFPPRFSPASSLRRRFCEQLLLRYKRMMLILGQLNHSHLVKLRSPVEPPSMWAHTMWTTGSGGGGGGGLDGGRQQQQSAISSRTLLSYFLDRLSLLDVEMLAESILAAAAGDLDESTGSVIMKDDVDDDEDDNENDHGNKEALPLDHRALASMLAGHDGAAYDEDSFKSSSSANNNNNNSKQRKTTTANGGSLLDLAKLIIPADVAAPSRVDGLEASEMAEWAAQLKRLEMENNEAWRDLLAKDLLYPWTSHKLPRPINPLTYDLFLHPNLTTRLVLGMVKIGFKLERPTRFIVLHCDRLNLVDVSLWLKQPDINNRNSSGGQSDSLQRVPISRILSNAKMEQIYIELQHQLMPTQTISNQNNNNNPNRNNNRPEFSSPHPTLNFGGELPLIQQTVRASAATNTGSFYILSASFNKTSLMKQPVVHPTDASSGSATNPGGGGGDMDTQSANGANEPEHGLEFVQYADYFAQSEAESKTILYTQFEPQNARRLFPAFDEPHFKAKFQLNLVHELGHQVLFNAPKRERVPYTSDGGHQMSVFEQTPLPLSTYLVAFVVCDAQNMKSITSRASQLSTSGFGGTQLQQQQQAAAAKQGDAAQKHIQVQIVAQFEQLGQAEFASSLVPQLLTFYQNHLHFPYPMDKLDLVAIPKAMPQAAVAPEQSIRLAAGLPEQQSANLPGDQSQQLRLNTMENMGLIWFKANQLLVDTNLISQNLIEQVAMIISHQLAHQYFGNIVSISQWDDLWLYESLCQYLESMALSQVQPDWRLEEQFVVTSIQDTLALEQFDWQRPRLIGDTMELQQQQSIPFKVDQTRQQLIKGQQPGGDPSQSSSPELDSELEAATGDPEMMLDRLLIDVPDQSQEDDETDMMTSFSIYRQQGTNELRRSSAILHMLLLNLLPTPEARSRLLSRCLSNFRYGTMSRAQFWRQFGAQLTKEGSSERLPPSLASAELAHIASSSRVTNPPDPVNNLSDDGGASDQLSIHKEKWRNFTATTEIRGGSGDIQALPAPPTERVVFVRPINTAFGRRIQVDSSGGSETTASGDAHKLHVRNAATLGRHPARAGLESTADAWLEQRGYPLLTASFNRDRIQLRQERFSFAWWVDEPAILDDEPEALRLENDGSQHGTGAKQVAAATNEEFGAGPTWQIPLMFVSRINQKQARFFWMDKREMELPMLELSSSSSSLMVDSNHFAMPSFDFSRKGHQNAIWFKLNVNQSSLVRVNYDERNWEALTELLLKSHYSNHLLGPLDRANLIDDSITLMRCGKLSVGVAMNLTLYLEVGEREFMPWTSALRHLDQMQTLLNQNPLWHRYVLKLIQPISSVIGWKDDGPHLMRKLRRSLFSVALQYGDEKTINKAKQEFKGWLKNGRFIVPNLQELVYVAGVRYGEQLEWFHCWQKYQQLVAFELGYSANSNSQQNQTNTESLGGHHSNGSAAAGAAGPPGFGSIQVGSSGDQNDPNPENEKRQLLTALASTHNTWLLEQFLNYSLDSTKIQPHHLKHVMQTLGKNPVARLYLWRFVRLNWNSLVDRYTTSTSGEYPNLNARSDNRRLRVSPQRDATAENYQVLETMIIESTKHFVTKLDYDEVKTFFNAKRKLHKQQRPDLLTWTSSLEQAIQQSLQVIRSNIYWRNHIEPKLTKWLSHYDSSILH